MHHTCSALVPQAKNSLILFMAPLFRSLELLNTRGDSTQTTEGAETFKAGRLSLVLYKFIIGAYREYRNAMSHERTLFFRTIPRRQHDIRVAPVGGGFPGLSGAGSCRAGSRPPEHDSAQPELGWVEDWRADIRLRWLIHGFRRGPQSGCHRHVSSPRHLERSMRISRTPLPCVLRGKGYGTHRPGDALGAKYWTL